MKRFADTQLGRHWSEMKSRLGGRHPLSVRQYLDQAPVVQRFNEVALAFAALYPQDEAQFLWPRCNALARSSPAYRHGKPSAVYWR
ncbi:hypothetical protein PCI56_14845 [Plesiomonas shigelloides subsp. oncorhynchi]|nr:hypothetical protein [Plesiomonas shigelloides]